MFRFLLVLVLPLLLIALAPAAPVPSHLMKKEPELYYPTRVGTKWVFDEDMRQIHATIIKSEIKDGAVHVVVTHALNDGTPRGTLTVAVSEKGVFRIAVDDEKDDPPVCWLKLPSKPGATWESFGFHLVAGGAEEIEVPAGKFRAIPVEMTRHPQGLPIRSTRWFAPDVGMIRQSNGERDQFVLKSFTPAKD